ncbi:MAG: AmmeMemoRadiSam system protein A [Candidatus Bathyarchaeota archaeon]|nr:AmmeMemoRadiSam system protein A [Candidatus Bathyarchaeota archaeon]
MDLVTLAMSAVKKYIKEGKIISPSDELSQEFLNKKAGTFVTLEKNGKLRGCIGTYLPIKESIAEEVISNAITAATKDYRFGPVSEEELPTLSCNVYILSEPELVKDIKELDPKEYGVIVRTTPIEYKDGADVLFNGHLPSKSGLLLPGLEDVDTIEKQIMIACQKGGINPREEKIIIYRFAVEKHQ